MRIDIITLFPDFFKNSFSYSIFQRAIKNKTTLKQEAIKSGLINLEDYDKIVDPKIIFIFKP